MAYSSSVVGIDFIFQIPINDRCLVQSVGDCLPNKPVDARTSWNSGGTRLGPAGTCAPAEKGWAPAVPQQLNNSGATTGLEITLCRKSLKILILC